MRHSRCSNMGLRRVLLVVYTVLSAKGKRFFAQGDPPRSFELVGTKAMQSGIILIHHQVAGPLKTR
jgi:hypothetical protein